MFFFAHVAMKKILLLLAGVVLAFNVVAQEDEGGVMGFYTPDYAQIKQDCLAPKGPLSFKELAKRFASIDTSMGLREMFTFYYGQSFLPGFFPYDDPAQVDEIRNMLRKMTDTVATADAKKIVALADKAIKDYPADPRCYYYKFIGQRMLLDNGVGDSLEVEKTRWQFGMLFETMTSTGNGLTPDVAIHVVNTAHEYLIMNIYGFDVTAQSLSYIDGHSYDVFALESNQYDVDSLYFCIDRVIEADMWLFASDHGGAAFDPEKKVTSVDIPLGTRFVLEMVKGKKKDSQFRIVEMTNIDDTLVADRDSLFREPVKEGQIVCYFAPMRLYAGFDHVSNCLVFVSGAKEDVLYYDTYMQTNRNPEFRSTSNSNMLKGVMMNEMWNDPIKVLRISNIRTKE